MITHLFIFFITPHEEWVGEDEHDCTGPSLTSLPSTLEEICYY
jgi:hypothetical protein